MRANALFDLHVHTKYCDGEGTPDEIVRAAIGKGLEAIGFSGHSYTAFDEEVCMTRKGTDRYEEKVRQAAYLRSQGCVFGSSVYVRRRNLHHDEYDAKGQHDEEGTLGNREDRYKECHNVDRCYSLRENSIQEQGQRRAKISC